MLWTALRSDGSSDLEVSGTNPVQRPAVMRAPWWSVTVMGGDLRHPV